MSVATVRAVLVASGAVTALVPATRIEPIRRTQRTAIPAIVLQRISMIKFPHLRANGSLKQTLVQLTVIDDDYTNALAIADACSTALDAAGYVLQSELDGYESETDPELYQIPQTWSVFT